MGPTGSPDAMITMEEMERRYVRQVLASVGGNKTHAARILGIDRRSLYRRLESPYEGVPLGSAVRGIGNDRPVETGRQPVIQ